jgi:tetrahydromethanopterin S-methyltransferase subunit G
MTKKCKFEVDVTYNSDYFAEAEIRDTIKNAIKELNNEKIQKFGRKIICDPGKINSGVIGDVNQLCYKETDSIDLVETLVSLSACMDDTETPNIVLPEPKLEELMTEVRTAFKK